ncbi:creatininase family protein [Phyllobacterium sp. SB3]|uniref:creatininase family protein n=1 Tax=Phyllobacterium sp. SB3 TaxID=3156073 RepID=UPI0032AF50D9
MPFSESNTIALLPLGAHEQHGPHLPFETDTLIVTGLVNRLKPLLPPELNIKFFAPETVGYSIEHMDVDGTKSLRFDEAVYRWIAVGKGLAEQGVSKFILLNAHGGNSPLLTIVATELRVRFNMLAVATSWTRFGLPEGLISPEEKAIDIHGGFIETSVMLALYPELVDMSKAANFTSNQSNYSKIYKHLRAYGPHAFGWKMSDLNKSGVAGNALLATAQAGEAIITHSLNGIIELIEDVAKFDNSAFSDSTAPVQSN